MTWRLEVGGHAGGLHPTLVRRASGEARVRVTVTLHLSRCPGFYLGSEVAPLHVTSALKARVFLLTI